MDLHEPSVAPRGPDEISRPNVELAAAHQARHPQPRSIGWVLFGMGVLSGLIAFALGELSHKAIPTKLVQRDLMGSKIMVPSPETLMDAATNDAALAFSALGFCLGGSLGIAGGFGGMAKSSRVRGGLIGAGLGLALGAGLSLGLLPWSLQAQADYPDHDLILALVTHALIWGLLGASAGLAFAIGLGEWRILGWAVTAGFAGAVVGAVAFELVGGTFFGLAETGNPVSKTWLTRFLARLLVTVGTSAAMAMTMPKLPKRHNTTQEIPLEPLPVKA